MHKPTIGELLRQSASRHPDLPFMIEDDRPTSFAEFDGEVDRLATGLLKLGVSPGDHIGIWLPNSRAWVLSFCAAARIGAVVVPVNTRYKADEASYVLRQSNIKVLFMLHRMWKTDYYETLAGLAPELPNQAGGALDLAAFPDLKTVVVAADEAPRGTVTMASLSRELDAAAVHDAEQQVEWSALLLISYTSGTTGKPKGVMHHHGVIHQSTKVGLAMHVEPGDRVMAHMPFYHSAGLFMGLIPALALGAALVPMVQWDAVQALKLIERHRITMFGGVPTHFYDLVDAVRLAPADTSSIKGAWIGGSAVMQETFENIKRTLGIHPLLSTYGMTENTISTSFNAWDDPVEVCCRNRAPLLSDCEVRIVDPETLETLGHGRDGEVWCRGDTVMMGYYRDPDATRSAVTADGWLRTGDIGNFDEKGYLAITGRLKEMLKIGGTNTSPIEIEQYLAGHPGIKSSVVVGVSDERLGQVPYAFVQAMPDARLSPKDIIEYCASRIAHYKVPRHVRFVDEFPRTETGKIKRAVMARQAEEDAGGSS
jgi:fatty-acyl-CoA synthase